MNIRSFGSQKEQTVVDMSTRKANPILHYDLDYDKSNVDGRPNYRKGRYYVRKI